MFRYGSGGTVNDHYSLMITIPQNEAILKCEHTDSNNYSKLHGEEHVSLSWGRGGENRPTAAHPPPPQLGSIPHEVAAMMTVEMVVINQMLTPPESRGP